MTLGDFTAQAAAYGRSRPSYPTRILDQLVSQLRLSPAATVADIGAGTGLWTELLAARQFCVTAIEPNEEMRRRAPNLNGVLWADGTFENTGLAPGSQDWIVAAQSFHWAQPGLALREIRRTLKRNGALTVLWNNRRSHRSRALRWWHRAVSAEVPEFNPQYRRNDWAAVLCATGQFQHVSYLSVPHTIHMPRARFVDLWRSHNRLTTLAGPARLNGLLNRLNDYLEQEQLEEVAVPYLCEAWTAR